jgi:hypothetical protein
MTILPRTIIAITVLAAGGCSSGGNAGGFAAAGGAAGSAGQAGAGASGGSGTCEEIAQAIDALIDAHQACSPTASCARLTLPENHELFCDRVAALGTEQATLDSLVAAWTEAACDGAMSCGHAPGSAECVSGSCQIVDQAGEDCASCPSTLEPKCTTDNQNALNACYAQYCLQQPIAHDGFCADSAACLAAGGSCEERSFDAPWCPDGTRWDKFEPERACAGGNLRNTCCVPWSEPCSFVSLSQTLDLDPFTCDKPTGAGNPWTCLHPQDQQGCVFGATLEQPFGLTYPGSIEITASFGSELGVKGSDPASGRSFTCSGKISYDAFFPQSWACSACLGGSCKSCTITASADCQL